MFVLEYFKDDKENFMTVWPFMGLDTVKKFREKFPNIEYTKKSEEELVWDDLNLFEKEKIIPVDGKSIFGDIIRLHAGEKVSRKELKDQSAFIDVLLGDFHQPNFDFAEFDGILSGGQRG